MAEPIVNPEIPYVGNTTLEPGKIIRIQGITYPNSDRFNINLATGPNVKPRDDTALHVSVRINQGYVARNSYKDGSWGDEEGNGKLPIGNGQSFEILLLVDPHHYKIAINGQHFCEFTHRIPFQEVSHLLIDGDVSVTLLSFEGAVPGGITAAQASQVNAAGNQGAPQVGGPQFGAPQVGGPQFGAPQVGGPQFGSGGPYGAPQQGYGGYIPPPPPGAEQQSEFGGIFEQAQEILASAIKSGAAEKLLGSILHSSGGQQQPQGYAHENARYGIYPDLPTQNTSAHPQNEQSGISNLLQGLLSTASQQQDNTRPIQQTQQPNQQQYGQYSPQQDQKGPMESLLSGLLSGGPQQQQQPHMPNVGGEGSVGGLGSMGGILGSLAGSLLHRPDSNQHH